MSAGFKPSPAAIAARSGKSASFTGRRGMSNAARPLSAPEDFTRHGTGPTFSSSTKVRSSAPPSRRASSTAVPTVGCPANGNSRAGVKMRSLARLALSAGGNTNTVSDRLNSRAIFCIAGVSSPSGSSTTASGLPARRLSVNTSSVAKRRRMAAPQMFSAGKIRLGLTNSSWASISMISREPAAAVRLSTPNTEDAARDSACAADPSRR